MTSLSEMSGFEEDAGLLSIPSSSTCPVIDVCKLRKCGHMLHKACLIMYMKNSSDANVSKAKRLEPLRYIYRWGFLSLRVVFVVQRVK